MKVSGPASLKSGRVSRNPSHLVQHILSIWNNTELPRYFEHLYTYMLNINGGGEMVLRVNKLHMCLLNVAKDSFLKTFYFLRTINDLVFAN